MELRPVRHFSTSRNLAIVPMRCTSRAMAIGRRGCALHRAAS